MPSSPSLTALACRLAAIRIEARQWQRMQQADEERYGGLNGRIPLFAIGPDGKMHFAGSTPGFGGTGKSAWEGVIHVSAKSSGKAGGLKGEGASKSKASNAPLSSDIGWSDKQDVFWHAQQWAARLNVKPSSITIGPLPKKWGELQSPTNKLTINEDVLKLPKELGEYVILHELTHLLAPNHGVLFQSYLHAYMPDWQQREARLREIEKGILNAKPPRKSSATKPATPQPSVPKAPRTTAGAKAAEHAPEKSDDPQHYLNLAKEASKTSTAHLRAMNKITDTESPLYNAHRLLRREYGSLATWNRFLAKQLKLTGSPTYAKDVAEARKAIDGVHARIKDLEESLAYYAPRATPTPRTSAKSSGAKAAGGGKKSGAGKGKAVGSKAKAEQDAAHPIARAKTTDVLASPAVQDALAGKLSTDFRPQANADPFMARVLAEQGFDGPAHLVSTAELDAAIQRGEAELWRGVMREVDARDFQSGPLSVGGGIYGSGTYTAGGDHSYAFGVAKEYSYYNGTKGAILRMSVKPGAKVVEYDALQKEQTKAMKASLKAYNQRIREATDKSEKARLTRERDAMQEILMNDGRFAALRGYDVINAPRNTPGNTWMIVINRTAVRVDAQLYDPLLKPEGIE